MAEVLGLVVGLASLAIELTKGAQKLRQRHEDAAKVHGDIDNLIEDLDLISKQLRIFGANKDRILEQQVGPIILERCRSRSATVASRLKSLTAIIPARSSKFQPFRDIRGSKRWKAELEELQSAIAGLKPEITCLLIIHQHIVMQNPLPAETLKSSGVVNSAEPPTTSGVEDSQNPVLPTCHLCDDTPPTPPTFRRLRVTHCTIRHCHCSCHKTKVMGGRFWRLQYAPLADIFKTCDNVRCTAQRYRIDMRVALSRFGVPWAVVFGLDFGAEPGKYWIQPVLQVESIVNYTETGFVILKKLSNDVLEWKDAESQFRELYKSNPAFVNQVDPQGRGYLEKALSGGAWGYYGISIQNQKQMLQFFVEELHLTKGVDSPGVMYSCASFGSENRHLEIINAIVTLGLDFSDTASPNFDLWPKPCIHGISVSSHIRYIPEDPFYMEYIGIILQVNPDFGDSPPLHHAIVHGSQRDFETLVQKSRNLERDVNFLGQSPLHLAVRYPSRLSFLLVSGHDVCVRDKNGITPLMYAAAMNQSEAVKILIEHDADLFSRDDLENFDFIMYAAVRDHWDLVWRALDLIESKDPSLLARMFPSILANAGPWCFLAHDPNDDSKGRLDYWSKVFSKLPINVCFEDGSTLMHFIDTPAFARALVQAGFAQFNQRNHLGEHSMFSIARFLDPSLVRLFIEQGCDVNLQNNQGHTILHELIDRLYLSGENMMKEMLEILEILLDSGADATAADHCSCNCSLRGCLPGSRGTLELKEFMGTKLQNTLWAFEWLQMLEERGRLAEAKEFSLSVLRQTYFDEFGLQHTCCRVDELNDREETFRDVEEQIKIDEINDKMQHWMQRDFPELKLRLMVHIRQRQSAKKAKIEAQKAMRKSYSNKSRIATTDGVHHGPRGFYVDYENDVMYSAEMMAIITQFWSPMAPNLFHFIEKCETRPFFDEFVEGLRHTRGDKFSSRQQLLDQLSSVFGLSITESE